MSGGQEYLATRMAQHLEKPTVSASIELTRHVVEQQDRHPSRALTQEVELCGLEGQNDGPVLALRTVVSRANLV